jgi:hypothetical protein
MSDFAFGRRVTPTAAAAAIAEQLPLIGWYRSSGNFAFDDCSDDEIRRVVQNVTGLPCAVVGAEPLTAGLRELAAWPCLPETAETRWTPGLGFALIAARAGALASTQRAIPRRLRLDLAAVCTAGRERRSKAPPRSTRRRMGRWRCRHRAPGRRVVDESFRRHADRPNQAGGGG